MVKTSAQLPIVRVLGLGTVFGVVTGVELGVLLKFIEMYTDKKVYTLLLNIDFVYAQPLPEWIEFALHLLVAIVLGIVYVWLLSRVSYVRTHRMLVGILIGVATIPAFFPLTALSPRTPAVDDWVAFGWWAFGHVMYGAMLGFFGHFVKTDVAGVGSK